MKQIILSFDDGRSDFYTRAFPIIKQYGLPCTLNVISDFVLCDTEISFPTSAQGLSKEELIICYKSGLVEIGCHGAHHLNKKNDVLQNISDLQNLGISESGFGFASPNSVLTEQNKNEDGLWDMVECGELLYIRSGLQIRREGYIYAGISLADRFLHSNLLFWYLNQRNIIIDKSAVKNKLLPSIAVFSYTKLHQLKSFIKRQEDSSVSILMFHSILKKGDSGYGKDRYYWDDKDFEDLCYYLKSQKDIEVCMTKDLFIPQTV